MDPDQPVITYASRAQAIVHLAIYDAYVGVTGAAPTYLKYRPLLPHIAPGANRATLRGA
jgi:hypothetical protein